MVKILFGCIEKVALGIAVKILFFMHLLLTVPNLILTANVRRYVALAQSRGGACFCTRGAMQDYDFDLIIIALAKTVTP